MSTTIQQRSQQHDHAVAEATSPVRITPRGVGQFEFMAMLLPGIFERKLINLIRDSNAKVKEFSTDLVRLNLGSTLLFVRNKPVDDVKVAITIRLNREMPCPNGMTPVSVEIRRRERLNNAAFERRCNQIVRAIQACFVGQELQATD